MYADGIIGEEDVFFEEMEEGDDGGEELTVGVFLGYLVGCNWDKSWDAVHLFMCARVVGCGWART